MNTLIAVNDITKRISTIFSVGAMMIWIAFITAMASADDLSLRENLIGFEHADSVWAIDAHYTVLLPRKTLTGHPTNAFCEELLSVFQSAGDIEMLVTVTDKMTDKKTAKWKRIDIKKGKSKYKHPVSGRTVYFLANDRYHYRVKGSVAINEFQVKKRKNTTGGYNKILRKIILHHVTPQPMVYKSPIVENLTLIHPEEGPINLRLFSRGLSAGVQDGDLIQYMALLGGKFGKKQSWIIPGGHGLAEVSAMDAYRYMSTTSGRSHQLFYYCDGLGSPFVLKKKGLNLEAFHRDLTDLNYTALAGVASAK